MFLLSKNFCCDNIKKNIGIVFNDPKPIVGGTLLRISTKGRYGLTIMMELGLRFGDGPTSLKSIAEKYALSEHYLEQLVSPLRIAGLVKSIRGAYGGYILTRPPEEITAGQIIRILEGPISPVDFTEEDDPAKRDLWIRIRDAVASVLDTTTLSSLIRFHDSGKNESYMFYI
jgi:Rrf2 family cysteine metabolism transcriptional repressor